MRRVTSEMLKIYVPYSNLDWMNYKLVKKDITYHHILKKSVGGKRSVENGCLLMPIAHQYLNLIENLDIDSYIALNVIFKEINEQKSEPTQTQRAFIERILQEFEREHRWDKGRKGKLLIQRKYLDRNLC